jgi:hypothetical protein
MSGRRAAVLVGFFAVLAPAATAVAKPAVPAQLALMPLPQNALGHTAKSLSLALDSGVVTNADAAGNANGDTTAAKLAALGRVTGYQLDYGGDEPSGARISQIETGVDSYRDEAAAVRGLAFWRHDEYDLAGLKAVGLVVLLTPLAVSGLGAGTFGSWGSATLKGAGTYHGADVTFRVGKLLASVSVTGSDGALARSLAVHDARALRARIEAVLAGRIAGKPVALPMAKAGPPAHGPDLKALALKPSDLSPAKVSSQGYRIDSDLDPVSEYDRSLGPGGGIASVQEQVALFRDVLQARFELAALRTTLTTAKGLADAGLAGGGDASYHPHPVRVRAGDQAFAVVGIDRLKNGQSISLAFVVIRMGRTLELVILGNPATEPLTTAMLHRVASAVAARAAHGLHRPAVA